MTWTSPEPPAKLHVTFPGKVIALLRGLPLVVMLVLGLGVLLTLRAGERIVLGLRRPLSPWVAHLVCRMGLPLLGLRLGVTGTPMTGRGAMVANHGSWLDIFALNAASRVYFVSKSEVADWPGIGLLARATGTVFIRRDRRREAQVQAILIEARLRAGDRLLFFPEGTSSDTRRVLPFKSALFAAFLAEDLQGALQVQPVSVTYHPPRGADPRLYGWWGDMGFGAHLLSVLSQTRRGRVDLVFHPPLSVAEYADRKTLALECENAVRAGFRPAGP